MYRRSSFAEGTIGILISLLACLGLVFSAPVPLVPGVADTSAMGIIRLHVLANSNLPRDQELKLLTRDEVLRELAPLLRGAGTPAQVRGIITVNQGRLVAGLDKVLAADGAGYGVKLSLGTAFFPTKAYGALILPAGSYPALRVLLGKGGGENWWCVLFPPLCLSDYGAAVAPAEPIPTKNQGQVHRVELKWWFAGLFKAKGNSRGGGTTLGSGKHII